MLKKCCKCGEEKPKTVEFFRLKNKDRGVYRSDCKRCESDRAAIRWGKRTNEQAQKTKERDRLRAAKKRAEKPDYFKALEAKRKNSANYRLWAEKLKEANKEKSFLRRIGSFCDISTYTCRSCGKVGMSKGLKQRVICGPCRIKGSVNLGLKIVRKQKEVSCKSCGNVHFAYNQGSMCIDCRTARDKAAKRLKDRQRSSFSKRCLKYGVRYTTINRIEVYRRDNWTCAYCGVRVVKSVVYKPNQATIDHVIPLSKGGSHAIDNVVTACQQCNSIKRDHVALKNKKSNQLIMWLQ